MPYMSERLKAFKQESGHAQVVENIGSDPVESALFGEYVRGIGDPIKRTALEEIIRRRESREGLSVAQQKDWQSHVHTFLENRKAADRTLANLNDKDVKELGDILTQSTAGIDPREFPLYIQGLAVRGGEDFQLLAERIATWKHAARNRVAERESKRWKEQLDRLAQRYGVTEEEIERFSHIEDEDERLRELQGAVEGRHWIKVGLDILRQPYFGTRAGALNATIGEMRRESADLRKGLKDIVTVLSGINTSTADHWWKELPGIFARKEALQSSPDSQKPKTLRELNAELQRVTSPNSLKTEWEATLNALGGDASAEWKRLRKVHAAAPAEIWKETFTDAGSNKQTFGEIRDTLASNIEGRITKRSLMSKFLEFVFGLFVSSNIKNAADKLATM